MNQPTHAWLALRAFETIKKCSATPEGKKHKLDGLAALLDQHLNDVVVAAWLLAEGASDVPGKAGQLTP